MSSEKRERFLRIAESRTQKVLNAMQSLGKCAATASYEYTTKDVDQICTAIESELTELKNKFSGKKHFSLSQISSNNVFKSLFSDYCKKEIDAGHCNKTFCGLCCVNDAYEKIFNK